MLSAKPNGLPSCSNGVGDGYSSEDERCVALTIENPEQDEQEMSWMPVPAVAKWVSACHELPVKATNGNLA